MDRLPDIVGSCMYCTLASEIRVKVIYRRRCGLSTSRSRNDLRLLRLHSIRRLEVFSSVGDELRVAWMVDSFHSNDDVHQLGIVVVNVLDQFGLCIGWSGNEDCTGVCNRFSGGVEIVVIL